jgi:hypothetical protein
VPRVRAGSSREGRNWRSGLSYIKPIQKRAVHRRNEEGAARGLIVPIRADAGLSERAQVSGNLLRQQRNASEGIAGPPAAMRKKRRLRHHDKGAASK